MIFAKNRKAKFDYFIEKTFESGISLTGDEVKSVRDGRCSIAESYVVIEQGEAFLQSSSIQKYVNSYKSNNHVINRKRKLLLHKKEIFKLASAEKGAGVTIVPLSIYSKGPWIKLEIAIARGKKEFDKRRVKKEEEWKRTKLQISRVKNVF